MAPYGSIQGSQSLSRYGDRSVERSYPRYYPRRPCRRRKGFTDLSRSFGRDCSRHGQCDLPDKEFRSVLLHPVLGWVSRFLFRSPLQVALQLGPYHPPADITGVLAYGL